MKNAKIILISLLTFLTLVCCKKAENTKDNHVEKIVEVDSFAYKLKNEPKIFLRYWSGMSYEEYLRVSNILTTEKILIKQDADYLYVLGDGYDNDCFINAAFLKKDLYDGVDVESLNTTAKKKIDGILLTGINQNIYNKYKSKYNLDPLQEVESFNLVKSLNTKYKNYDPRSIDERIHLSPVEIESILSECMNNLYSIRYLGKYKKLVVAQNRTIVKKDNVIIIDNFNFYNNPESYYPMYRKKDSDDKNYETENKYKITVFEKHPEDIGILYLSTETYKKCLKNMEDNQKNTTNKKLNDQNYKNERDKSSYNEI
jgi:hypothetical protein